MRSTSVVVVVVVVVDDDDDRHLYVDTICIPVGLWLDSYTVGIPVGIWVGSSDGIPADCW